MSRALGMDEPAIVYILHFSRPYRHAQHYTGCCKAERLDERLNDHFTGKGSPLVWAAVQAGIEVELARTFLGNKRLEQRIKRMGGHGAQRLCPYCCAEKGLVPLNLARKKRQSRAGAEARKARQRRQLK